MDAQRSQADLLWKDLTTEFYLEFVLFFFGKKLYNLIDTSIAPDFLEQEFNETFIGNEPNKKAADKIMRFRLKNGASKLSFPRTITSKSSTDCLILYNTW